MPLSIRSDEVDRLADKLASVARVSKTEAVRIALVNELDRREKTVPLAERAKPIQDAFAALPKTGLKADKAFYDSLYDEQIFVDASAVVTVLAKEPGHRQHLDALETATAPLTSGMAILEAVMAVHRMSHGTVAQSEILVRTLLTAVGVTEVPVTPADTRIAISAFARYGKGRGHPAQLNFGDCFAYACARSHDVLLLFVGNDFGQTDIRAALT